MKHGLLKYKAFLFDLNGTVIDDMQYHVRAWHNIVNGLGANLSMEQVEEQCYGKNNDLLKRVFPARFSEDEMDAIGAGKENQYREQYRPELKLIDGLGKFLECAYRDNIKMGIGSAAITGNIDFVLDGLDIRKYFTAIVSADHVENSKPDPETFHKCADALQTPYNQCLVFEDAPKGVEAAENAGMNCVVISTMHGKKEFAKYGNVVEVISDYRGLLA